MAKTKIDAVQDSATTNTEETTVPARGKKIEKKSFSLSDFKAKNNLNDEVKDKPLDFIRVSQAFEESTGLGIAVGYFSIVAGHSSVGKSTLVMEAIVGAQKRVYYL